MRNTRKEIIHFWFEESQPQQWFQKNDSYDREIKERFSVAYDMAREGLCDHWTVEAEGSLAFCILLDQFPRNMFRGSPKAFETDAMALDVAKAAIEKGFDKVLPVIKRRFLYLPFEHSESIEDQKRCVALFEQIKEEDPLAYDYAVRHLEVIEKYGRFPHRNKILGRQNTPEEEEYLADPDAGF